MRPSQTLLVICFIFAASGLFSQSDDTVRQQWDLTEIYASVEDWDRAMTEIAGQVENLDQYKGTLGNSAGSMADALAAVSQTDKEVARVYVYASL